MSRLLYLIVRAGDLELHPTRDAYIISGTVLRKAIERAATMFDDSEPIKLEDTVVAVRTQASMREVNEVLGLPCRPGERLIVVRDET